MWRADRSGAQHDPASFDLEHLAATFGFDADRLTIVHGGSDHLVAEDRAQTDALLLRLGVQGEFLLTVGSRGSEPDEFWLPSGIFIDDSDKLYVCDTFNQRVQIFNIIQDGNEKN